MTSSIYFVLFEGVERKGVPDAQCDAKWRRVPAICTGGAEASRRRSQLREKGLVWGLLPPGKKKSCRWAASAAGGSGLAGGQREKLERWPQLAAAHAPALVDAPGSSESEDGLVTSRPPGSGARLRP
jgi:hypothetical protein